MLTIRRFVNSLSTRSVSMLFVLVCLGFMIGCSGEVNGPKLNVSDGFSGEGFNAIKYNFSAEKTVESQIPVESHGSVNIEAINGEVVVTGHGGADTVLVTAQLIVESDTKADADLHIDELEILVTDNANEILIQTIQPKNSDGRQYSVEYDIVVPSNFAVITTQVNGSIYMVDMENSVDVININGHIRLSDINGSVAADVVNGNVTATVTLPVHDTIDLITDNGSIELRIPRSTSAELGASVENGAIHTSNIAFTDLVQTSHWLTGTLGNGEGVIDLNAGNGDISVLGFE